MMKLSSVSKTHNGVKSVLKEHVIIFQTPAFSLKNVVCIPLSLYIHLLKENEVIAYTLVQIQWSILFSHLEAKSKQKIIWN